MTAPVITATSPTNGASGVSTSTVMTFSVQTTLPEEVDEFSIQVQTTDGAAITPEVYPNDGKVLTGQLGLTSNIRVFTSADIGKLVRTTNATVAANNGRAVITSIQSPSTAIVKRPNLTGFVNVTNGSITVIGLGTLFTSELVVGDYVAFGNAPTTTYKVSAINSDTNISLLLPYNEPTQSTINISPAFQGNDYSLTWSILGFNPGWSGFVNRVGANNVNVSFYRTQLLDGLVSVSGTQLLGVGTSFTATLNGGSGTEARVSVNGKHVDEQWLSVTSISDDTTATISTPSVFGGLNTYSRNRDISDGTFNVIVDAKNNVGEASTLSYTFSTVTRPEVVSASAAAANSFGLGARITFSSILSSFNASGNPAILNPGNYVLESLESPPIPVPSIVTVQALSNPTYVDVFFSAPLVNGKSYRLSVNGIAIRSQASNASIEEGSASQATFNGIGPVGAVDIVKDTAVKTPFIFGDIVLDYNPSNGTYQIFNLDEDVAAIALGPQSRNVSIVPGSFVNNGNGTGVFEIQFEERRNSYAVTIEATDDVDNTSEESNVLGISVRQSTIPGTKLSLVPLEFPHKAVCDQLLSDIPSGTFYQRTSIRMPLTYDRTAFVLRVVDVGLPVTIAISRETGTSTTPYFDTIIPDHIEQTIFLPLSQGRNLILVTDGIRNLYVNVTATYINTILCVIANEIYNYQEVDLKDMNTAIYSPSATRLAEPYIPDQDILPYPSIQSQQTLSTKMFIRSAVSDSGSSRAVSDVLSAISVQTPFMERTRNSREVFNPGIDLMYMAQEDFAGYNAHVWFHNRCIAEWLAFIQYMNTQKPSYRFMQINENEILLKDLASDIIGRSTFNFNDPACSTLSAVDSCFDNIQPSLTATVAATIPMCAATYTLDSCFSYDYPLSTTRTTFDTIVPWDAGDTLDQDSLDPTNDGWIGLCWDGRWDGGHTQLLIPVDGSFTEDDNLFVSGSYNFTASDLNKWVKITSGSRQNLYKIIALAGTNSVRLNHYFDVSENNLDWEIVIGVRTLDDTIFPSDPAITVRGDGTVIAGSNTFSCSSYIFSTADLNANLIIDGLEEYPVSVRITQIVNSSTVRVSKNLGTSLGAFQFAANASGLDWALWKTTPVCTYDGFSNMVVALTSADCNVSAAPVVTITGLEDTP